MTKKAGRGLFATKRIKKGTIIMDCEILALSYQETWHCDQTRLKYYMFEYHAINNGCLVLGDGMLLNHNKPDNVHYKLIKKHGREFVRFKALRDIKVDEELFIDYTRDSPTLDITGYLK